MWAIEHWGVEPDILLTRQGHRVGHAARRDDRPGRADETWGPGAHGSTFGGNPVACAAALATIELLEGGLIDNAARARRAGAGRPRDRSRIAIRRLVRDVRGKGLMIGVEFDSAEHAEEVQWACFQRGLLVLECGKATVRMSPAADRVRGRDGDTALRIFGEAVADGRRRRAESRSPRRRGRRRDRTRSKPPADAGSTAPRPILRR